MERTGGRMVDENMPEELDLKRKQFLEKLNKPLIDENSPEYSRYNINWIDECKTWQEVKNKNLDFLNREDRLVFLAHFRDICKGKPQLIHQTIQKIPLIKKVEKIIKATKFTSEKIIIQHKFIDDRYDKRYDGRELDCLPFDFWIYRLVEQGKEYYLLSQNVLTEEYSELIGMKIDLDDLSGISETLRVNKLATIFVVKESKSAVKILPKEELVNFVKDKSLTNGWTEQGFQDYIFTHPDGNIYEYTEDFNKLRIAQFLSGKYEGYPLHLMKMGAVGTGKTTEAEAIDFKFREELGILEAGTSRMKVLVPSFKEKPANLGYICNCNRIAIIDELMKMVSSAIQNQHLDVNNYFGELNMLLEQKKRLVGSGNDNSTIVKSTSKVCITTNPIKGKNRLANHLAVLDNTTLSRMLIWIQDKEEVDKIYSKEGIRSSLNRISTKSREYNPTPLTSFSFPHIEGWDSVHGNYFDFLTIYDSCQEFLCVMDYQKIKEAFTKSVNLAKEPMKQVWRSRGLHHTTLILDGLTKFRCLFRDYDSSFIANEQDYAQLDKILTHMIKTWDSDLEYQEGGF
jgi:hypothetical protein